MARVLIVVFYGLSFFSGMAALIYELAWAKMLALTFGSTTLSAGAVIAGFMGGMGVGARLYHRIYDRLRRSLMLYGCLEIGIAGSAALITLTMYSLPALFAEVSNAVPSGPWLAGVRLVGVLVLLFIPAALMGATFPALCTVMIRTASGVDRHLGMIYGINTIGGAAGVLLAGMVLIERFGLSATVRVGNVINVVVGCTALALVRTSLSRDEKPSLAGAETAIPTYLPRWLTGTALFVSGFATLGYEILWFRALRYSVGNSVYALTTVLVIFLIGLGLGSLMLQRVARRRSPERDLALCQCAIAVLAMAAMACQSLLLSLPGLRDYISIFSEAVQARPWWWRLLVDAGAATLTMLPATLFMGLSFPLASRLFLGDVKKLSARTGGAYLLANLGSVLGAILAAVVLLPMCGTIGGTKVLAGVNLALGLVLAVAIRRRTSPTISRIVVAAGALTLVAVLLPSSLSLEGEQVDGVRGNVVFVEEGDLATVQVLEKPGDPTKRAMTIDGYKIGWSAGFVRSSFYRKQVLLAHLPMVLDTRIRQTLNVGLGSGATLQALASYEQVESLDCVEISSAVVRACKFFPESEVLDDPRVELIVDDAVHYLLRSEKRYDLVISDGKQHPFFGGNASLLCREFYRYVLDRLTENGLFIQWIPIGMLSSDLTINLRTLCDVFPYVEVFYYPLESVFMVGSPLPLAGRPGLSGEEFLRSPAHEALAPYMIENSIALYSRWVAGKRQLLDVLSDGPISTWDHLLLDFSTFKTTPAKWGRAQSDNLRLLLSAEAMPRSAAQITFDVPESAYWQSAKLMRRAFAESFAGRTAKARAFAKQAVEANPDDAAAKAVLGVMEEDLRKREARRKQR